MRKTIAPGIVQDAYGFEAVVSVGSTKTKLLRQFKRFPRNTHVEMMQTWQAGARLRLIDQKNQRPDPLDKRIHQMLMSEFPLLSAQEQNAVVQRLTWDLDFLQCIAAAKVTA